MPAEGDNTGANGDEDGDKEEMMVQPHFSKVDVVEMAVGFIRRLKRENERLAKRVSEGRGKAEGRETAEGEKGRGEGGGDVDWKAQF